ncbi:hypothetical protein V8E51_005045 [Hyaloscypha variabilis]
MATSSLIQLLLLCSQCLPVIAQLQFISYNGSITGNLQPGASAPSSCQSYYLQPIGNATFQVGVNPPWDTNPFYFAFYAAGNVAANLPALECGSGLCTYDSFWDLGFITAEDKCIVNATGDECNGFYSSGQIYYLPIEALNPNEAKIAPIQLAGANGYSVTGDQSTAGNLTVNNGFSFQQPHNYTLAGVNPCFWDQLYFYWNSSTPFTYALNFTNSTVSALFTLTAPYGIVSISYSGSRFKDNIAFASQTSNGFQVASEQWIVLLTILGLGSLVLFS